MEIVTRHEPDSHRFVVHLEGGAEATLEYRHAGAKTLDYRSTFVPVEHRGRGIGDRMVLDALDYARENDYSVIPSCSFVRSIVKRHSEYQDLIAAE
jgi:predicted GNAT family acetyltransferase